MLTIGLFILLACAGRGISAQDYRLREDVVPDSYDIAIKPYLRADDGLKQFTFDGEVNITLRAVEQNVQNITLHKDYMDILETIVYSADGKVVEHIASDQLVYENDTDQLTIRLQTPLEEQVNYTLYFKYTGQIRSDLAGVFRASYDNTNWYAITQLHRIDARTAFPCFDEPQLKATFRMRITRPKEYNSFFNTRLLKTIAGSDGRYTDYFEETPRMSTYLVAFLVGDFMVEGNTDFKLIMNAKFKNKTAFTHEVAKKTMDAYDTYMPMTYKSLGNTIMQMVGSVSFPHSGMENWGLIVYKDDILAHEPLYTDGLSNKENTIMLLVHEVAHMWFGNSVTHKWWSYFWLNEGFARYYQYFMANKIYPDYQLDQQFVVKVIHRILDTDATNSSQPMTSPEDSIQTPAEIGYKFSSIAYDKAAAVAHMISNIMGKENFDNAIREYLKENHLKSTVPDDLFFHWKRHWPAGHNVDLEQLFKDWTEQPGYPLIRLSTTASGKYSLKQERFLLDPQDGSDATLRYTVPITYTTNRERNFEDLTPKFYLNKTNEAVEFGDARGDADWIVLNLQQSNYHRVFYEASMLDRLRKALMAANHSGIHIINRAHLVDDLFTYGRIGLLDFDEVFKFLEYLATETEYLPWEAAFKGFAAIYHHLTSAQHEKFGQFLNDISAAVYTKLGFENNNDTVLDVYNRRRVVNWLCNYDHKDCRSQAQRMFRESSHWFLKISPDFRETLYCAACRGESPEFYTVIRKLYKEETVASEKDRLLRAMGCTQDFDQHYSLILSDAIPQAQKSLAIMSMYTQVPQNVKPLFRKITLTADLITEQLGSWSSTAFVISDMSYYFTTQEELKMLTDFIDSDGHLFGTSVSILEYAVKVVEQNLAWSEKHLGKLFDYLDQRGGAVSWNSFTTVLPAMAIAIIKLS